MNYARIRNKLKEKQKELSKMSGADRTKLEQHIIASDSEPEALAPVEAEKVEAPKAQAQGNRNANRRN